MLSTLSIRDVVLIDRLELEFPKGLCALTGETGAGKSILLDALGLSLGARADARLVRHGAEQAVVSAGFDLAADHPARALLREQGLDDRRRRLAAAARREQRRPLAGLRQRPAGERGPASPARRSARRSPRTVRQSAPARSGRRIARCSTPSAGSRREADACADAWRAWRAAAEARAGAEADLEQARRDEDYLRHALEELTTLSPRDRRGDGAGASARAADERGEAGAGARRGVGRARRRADSAARSRLCAPRSGRCSGSPTRWTAALIRPSRALDRALSEAIEAQALLDRALADADLDPRQLEHVEERLFALRALARKHGVAVDDLARLREDFAHRLASLEDGGHVVARLREEEAEASRAYGAAASRLSAGPRRRGQTARCRRRRRAGAAAARQGALRHPRRGAGASGTGGRTAAIASPSRSRPTPACRPGRSPASPRAANSPASRWR